MTLTIKERFLLLLILPREGNMATLRIVQNLRAALSFSEEDWVALKIVQNDDGFTWDENIPQDTEVELGPRAQIVIQDTLNEMDKAKKLTDSYFSLWDKFCEAKDG